MRRKLNICAIFLGLTCFLPIGQTRIEPFPFEPTDIPERKQATVGRYIYVGDAPRFEASDLELHVSKIALTLRVKAWVKHDLPEKYQAYLLERWNHIHQAFKNENLDYVKMLSPEQIVSTASSKDEKSWSLAAIPYMKHTLDGTGTAIYAQEGSAKYKEELSKAILRSYMKNNSLTLRDGEILYVNRHQNLSSSVSLFNAHLGDLFTKDPSHGPDYVGYLTFVYPIAAGTQGPFGPPSEGIEYVGLEGSMEARKWSDKWQDEYGGMPFLLYTSYGIAFHGPISHLNSKNIWFVRRGYVSHGCNRMDPSDVLELRTLLPDGITSAGSQSERVKVYITTFPDVTDTNGDGKLEVMDSDYYNLPLSMNVPSGSTPEKTAAGWSSTAQQQPYWQYHFALGGGILTKANTPNGYSFDSRKGVFTGLPRYEESSGKLSVSGTYSQEIGMKVYEFRGSRVIQYTEAGAVKPGYEDTGGHFPPDYFVYPSEDSSKW